MNTLRHLLFALLAGLLACAAPVSGNTLTLTYFTIDPSDPDINHLCCGTYSDMVAANLGANGFPVLNPGYGGAIPQDVTAANELTWWSPTLNPHVTQTGSTIITLPFNVTSNFFPPNGSGSSDQNGYQSAILSGTLTLASDALISFAIGADDSAFAFLDGINVCDLGGVHGFSMGTCVTPFTITAGTHTLQVFFDDLNAVQSGLYFDVTTQGATTDPGNDVPEPASLLLTGSALLILALRRRS